MTENTILCRSKTPLIVFITVSLSLFLFVFTTGVLVTFIMPEAFVGSARVKIDRKPVNVPSPSSTQPASGSHDPYLIQTQFEIIQSEAVLTNVIEQIGLSTRWGRKYFGDKRTLNASETLELLKGRLDIRPVRSTSLIEIRVFSDDATEAAEIANQITKAYSDYGKAAPEGVRVRVIDAAEINPRPQRPNKPLNIALSAVVGAVLGVGVGAFSFWLTSMIQRKRRASVTV